MDSLEYSVLCLIGIRIIKGETSATDQFNCCSGWHRPVFDFDFYSEGGSWTPTKNRNIQDAENAYLHNVYYRIVYELGVNLCSYRTAPIPSSTERCVRASVYWTSHFFCAFIWAYYEVRLERDVIRFGLKARRSIGYAEISKIVNIRNQGSPRAELITNTGKRIKIWSNLLGYENLISELKAHCDCGTVRIPS